MPNSTDSKLSQKLNFEEGLPLRFAAGISTAVAAVCCAQPTEVTDISCVMCKRTVFSNF